MMKRASGLALDAEPKMPPLTSDIVRETMESVPWSQFAVERGRDRRAEETYRRRGVSFEILN